MPLKSNCNHIVFIMEGKQKKIRFVLKIHHFVLRLSNISFCGLYKGWKADWLDGTANVYYLTLPIHLGGRVSIGDNSYFHFQAGPQLGFGVAGSDIEIYEVGTAKYSDWGKRFEAGVGAKVGVEFNKLQVNVSGNYGITECMDGAGHNLDFAVGVAYMF